MTGNANAMTVAVLRRLAHVLETGGDFVLVNRMEDGTPSYITNADDPAQLLADGEEMVEIVTEERRRSGLRGLWHRARRIYRARRKW